MRWTGRLALSGALLVVAAVPAAGQAAIFLGGGITIPVSNYGEFAKTGWKANAGLTFDVGDRGVWAGGEGFYGSNKHDGTSGDKTDLFGASGLLGYNFQNAGSVHPYVYGGAGFLSHKYKPGSSAAGSETESKFNWLAAGGIIAETSPTLSLWIEGRFDGAKDSEHVAVQAGVSLRVGRRN